MPSVTLRRTLFAAIACACLQSAHAASLLVSSTFNELTRRVDTFFIVGGLGDRQPPSLGGFDLDFGFNTDALALRQVRFFSLLGQADHATFDNVGGTLRAGSPGAGDALADALLDVQPQRTVVSFDELSLLSSAALDNLQSGRFIIADLVFEGLPGLPNVNPGRTGFHVDSIQLSDAFGNPIPVEHIAFSPAPVPPTLALTGIGLLALWRIRAARRA